MLLRQARSRSSSGSSRPISRRRRAASSPSCGAARRGSRRSSASRTQIANALGVEGAISVATTTCRTRRARSSRRPSSARRSSPSTASASGRRRRGASATATTSSCCERAPLPALARACSTRHSRTSPASRSTRGEYKLMGLAPYGEPRYADRIREQLLDLQRRRLVRAQPARTSTTSAACA